MNFRTNSIVYLLLIVVGVLIGVVIMLLQSGDQRRPVQFTLAPQMNVAAHDPIENVGLEAPYIQFKQVAAMVTPTVVFLEASVIQNRMAMPNDENHRGRGNDDLWNRFLPGRRVAVAGSGVLITHDGYILTNNHVVANAERGQVTVALSDKRTYRARIIGQDPNTDLAVIKVDDTDLPHIPIGNSDQVEVGDWVLAVGNPFRLRSTVTAGIVSALGRNVDIINTPLRIESFIQTDAAINRGNSGGALVDVAGNLIGINTAIATESGVYEGYGFAIPSNMALKIAQDMIEYGEVRRAYLGVEIQSISFDRARNLGMANARGVEVSRVVRNGSADKAGIRVTDVILEVNGQQVNESHELQARIAMVRPGDGVDLRIWSRGEEKFMRVTLVGRDDDSVRELLRGAEPETLEIQPDSETPVLREMEFRVGFRAAELKNQSDLSQSELIITRVDDLSRAARAGMRVDDQIMSVNGINVNSLEELDTLLRASLRENGRALLMAKRNDGSITYLSIRR
jgi:serine protease Do